MAVVSFSRGPALAPRSIHNPGPAGDIDITRLWRAFVSQSDWRRPEITAFIRAASRDQAAKKIAAAVALIELGKPEEVLERVYNCSSGDELISENISRDHAARLFETGWSGGEVIAWVRAPLVLLADPAPLLAAWARVTGGAQ